MAEITLSYPSWVDTDEKKLKYLLRVEGIFSKIHNAMGLWFSTGLTLTQWNKFPARVKNRYPYSEFLTKEKYRDFEYDWKFGLDKLQNKIFNQRDIISTSFRTDIAMDVDFERDII